MEICISSASIWFRVTAVAVALYAVVTFLLFFRGIRLRFRSILHNRKKLTHYNPILGVPEDSNSSPLLNKSNNNVPAQKISQVKILHVNDTKDSGVQVLRVYTYQSLVDATENFLSVRCMYSDGLGQVFIGQMVGTSQVVVIRRLKGYTHQSVQGYVDEALLLSQVDHPNLAKLIGYCAEQLGRFLVYEYVPGISLKDRLHGNLTCLDWNTRMKIVLGIARALEYLQNTMKPPILHCFIGLSDIWLDGEYTPKLCGFGVIRMYPSRYDVNCPYDMNRTYAYGMNDYHLTPVN
ncbi:hypothetical protein RND81_01G162900 [Saponaria officinalis]|uniref:Protein kinase domain-containing protein n=1 Tax=Saponaria officinalis TaxID=3572 RepID=A0AAW1NHM0_SAPOF